MAVRMVALALLVVFGYSACSTYERFSSTRDNSMRLFISHMDPLRGAEMTLRLVRVSERDGLAFADLAAQFAGTGTSGLLAGLDPAKLKEDVALAINTAARARVRVAASEVVVERRRGELDQVARRLFAGEQIHVTYFEGAKTPRVMLSRPENNASDCFLIFEMPWVIEVEPRAAEDRFLYYTHANLELWKAVEANVLKRVEDYGWTLHPLWARPREVIVTPTGYRIQPK